MQTKIEISYRTVIFTLALLAAIWFLLQVRDILFLLFISFILMSALRPIVEYFGKHRARKVVVIIVLYGIIFGGLGTLIASLIPAITTQSTRLFEVLPDFLDSVFPGIALDTQSLIGQIAPVGENIVRVTLGVFSNILNMLMVLTITFYFLLERRHMKDFFDGLLGNALGDTVFDILTRVEKRLGVWLLGQLFLMVLIGVLVFIGLFFLGIEFALPLAIIAGILEIVPTIGPIISAFPAIIVALAHSPVLALTVVALYIIIQQLENNIIVPMIMKRSVGIHPVLTILVLLIGGRLGGTAGAILAIPVFITLQEIIASLPNTFGSENTSRTS